MPSKKTLKSIDTAAKARAAQFSAAQQQQAALKVRKARDNRVALLASAGAVVFALLLQLAYFGFGPGSSVAAPSPSTSSSANSAIVPSPEIAEDRVWTGTMMVNGKELGVEIDGAKAPQAAANFISLANSGFYADNNCHRLVTAGIYVLQCGDPNGDGTDGPGYSWGPIENAPDGDTYKTGVLAMARQSGNGSSMGSQFFIVYKDSVIPSDAAGGYTVFGKITSGLENLAPIIDGGVSGGSTDGAPAIAATLGAISLK